MDFDPISAKAVTNIFDPSTPIPASPLNSSEKKWMTRIVMMLRGAEAGELSVRERDEAVKEDLGEDSDVDWDYEDSNDGVKSHTGRHLWTKEKMDAAYAFYRSGTRKRNNDEGCQSLKVMHKKHSFIKTDDDVRALRDYGRTGVLPTNRNAQLQLLAEDLDREVTEMIDAGTEFHDCNLQEIALAINEEKGYWPTFKASEGWIRKWKAKYRITSRHITKIVSVKTNRDKEKTLKLELREKVQKIVEDHPDIYVWNCDQTGMVKEAHGKRTNARVGSRTVEVVVQSKGATTSSITLLPIIGSDGYLKPNEFVQLGEPGGKLPQKGCFRDANLEIAVGTSHIMGKEAAKEFYKKVLFNGFVPPKLLLILDSWPCFKRHDKIRAAAPPNCQLFIMNIPPGGTSLCQPADLSFNHQLKGIQKRLKSFIVARKIDYKVSQRDNLLRFVSQLHFCMGADRFKHFIQYGFFKGGFIKDRPPRFVAPKEYIFGKGSMAPCSVCSSRGCCICPRCEKPYCFHCFWVLLHRC